MNAASAFSNIPIGLMIAIVIPMAAYALMLACNFCGADAPSFKRSLIVSALVGAVAFFTVDGLGFALVMGTRDVSNLQLPPGFGYGDWLQESMVLKWQAMGAVPILRYLPLLFALCISGILYVFLLREDFRIVMVVFLTQWVLTTVGAGLVAFGLSAVFGTGKATTASTSALGGSTPSTTPSTAPTPDLRSLTRPSTKRNAPAGETPKTTEPPPASEGESGLKSKLQGTLSNYNSQLSPFFKKVQDSVDSFTKQVNPYVEPVRVAALPYTQYLPPFVQEFLDDGGWVWVILGLGLFSIVAVRSMVKRTRKAFKKKKKRKKKLQKAITIDLEEISHAMGDPGPNQVTVRSFPGRLRLVVMAPASSYVGELLPEMAESLLDWLKPGLGEVYENDTPRVVIWPRCPSETRFFELFASGVVIPEERGRKSKWITVAGITQMGRQRIYLGIAVHLDKGSYMREIQVGKDKWTEVLSIAVTDAD